MDVDLGRGVEGACGAEEDAIDECPARDAYGYEDNGCDQGANASFVF